MKLSEAIRIGSTMTKHNKGNSYFEYDFAAGESYACALGAAILGFRTVDKNAYGIKLAETVPGWKDLSGEIIQRNRTETREQIADWVEQQGY